MTTYTLRAIELRYDQFDNGYPTESTLEIVVPDGIFGFSYSILQEYDNAFPDVELYSDAYSVNIPSGEVSLGSNGFNEVGILTWNYGNSSTVFLTVIPYGTGSFPISTEILLPLAGSVLPTLDSLNAFLDWYDSIVLGASINSGTFAPNQFIPFSAIEGISVTENDVVRGEIQLIPFPVGLVQII
ncbi:hypothetical protein [Sulfitobacter sediminilitoris]|uniref:hypothetical protein n=1 Tax=Sulfitobacter sediminilitoris TaxID=2698830 RepID=UPI003612D1C0